MTQPIDHRTLTISRDAFDKTVRDLMFELGYAEGPYPTSRLNLEGIAIMAAIELLNRRLFEPRRPIGRSNESAD